MRARAVLPARVGAGALDRPAAEAGAVAAGPPPAQGRARRRGGMARRGHGARHGTGCRQPLVGTGQPAQGRGHHGPELLQIDRLGEVIVGTSLQGLDRVFSRTIGRDDDRLLAAALLLEPAQQVEPAAIGQAHVGDDGAEAPLGQARQALLDRTGGLDLVALAQQGHFIQGAQVRLVVDHQQGVATGTRALDRPGRKGGRFTHAAGSLDRDGSGN